MTTRPINGTQKADVYSFAIILQEIMFRAEPYFVDVDHPQGTVYGQKATGQKATGTKDHPDKRPPSRFFSGESLTHLTMYSFIRERVKK